MNRKNKKSFKNTEVLIAMFTELLEKNQETTLDYIYIVYIINITESHDIYNLMPGFHIVVSDGDVPASTGTWRRCIGDILKSWIDLNFSHLDWDVGDTTRTSATSPKKRSHIIVSVLLASLFHWLGRIPVTYDDMETRLNKSKSREASIILYNGNNH